MLLFSFHRWGKKKDQNLSLRKGFNDFFLSKLGTEPRTDSNFLLIWPEALPLPLLLSSLLISNWVLFFNYTNTTSCFSCFVQGIAHSQYLFMQSTPSTAVWQLWLGCWGCLYTRHSPAFIKLINLRNYFQGEWFWTQSFGGAMKSSKDRNYILYWNND